MLDFIEKEKLRIEEILKNDEEHQRNARNQYFGK